jgi:hypothetical protein
MGNVGVEWAMMSVCLRRPSGPDGRLKRTARPCGSVFLSVSGIWGRPVEVLKRARIGVEGLLKWGAEESAPAEAEGVKTPLRWWPFAWAEGVRHMVWSKARVHTRTETRVLSEDLLERANEVFGGLEGSSVGRERHIERLGDTEELEYFMYGSVN